MNNCDICKRNIYHGGKCYESYKENCLAYQEDSRGKLVYKSKIKVTVPFGYDISEVKINNELDWFRIQKVWKNIKIKKIYGMSWDKANKGLRGVLVICDVSYWSNEDLDKNNNNNKIKNKKHLKLIKL